MIHACFAGCDISARWLDLCFLTARGLVHARLGNDAEGVAELVEQCHRADVVLMVLEASGGYEARLLDGLWEADLALALVPAQRVRYFARADGELAKTDRIDALILAQYGARMQPATTPPVSKDRRLLRGLVDRRRVLVRQRAAERKRKTQAILSAISASIERIIAVLDAEIKALEIAIKNGIAACRSQADKARRMQSLPGIGPITSAVLLAHLPEIGHLRPGQIAALAGVAPHVRDSGKWRGKRFCSGGRKPLRDAMFMAATSAAFHTDTIFAAKYRNLVDNGKPHKVAITAIMRKMLITLNAMIREQKDFTTK